MRALANQDKLTFNSLAASLAVRRTMLGAAGLCEPVPPMREDCDVISVRYPLAMKRLAAQRPGSPGHRSPFGDRSAMNHIDIFGHRARDFCRCLACGKRPRLRSSRFPHASLLGERMKRSRKVSNANAA